MMSLRNSFICLLILLITACGWGGGSYYTIEDLEDKKVDIENDIPVKSSRKKAIYSYRELLDDEDQKQDPPVVLRRLGDLRLEENEDLQAIDVSDPQVTQNFTTTRIDYQETIDLYEYLLDQRSDYALNDVVLYQLSRAYEAADEREKMLRALDRLVRMFPDSDYYIEAQFRRGETLFVDKKYAQAEAAYSEVIELGRDSRFYQHGLYKQGWSHFKQLDYDVGLHSFIALLDTMIQQDVEDDIASLTRPEKELLDDSLRALGLSYGYLGGAREISQYFSTYGKRPYESLIYDRLGTQFLGKQRFSDAANTYREFVKNNSFSRLAPDFQIKAIEAFKKGKFPSEVLNAKKQFVENYHLNSDYWTQNNIDAAPHVIEFLKSNITDLATYYHSVAQKSKKKPDYIEATRWYQAYIASFPDDPHSSHMNFMLAEIWYETKEYENAVREFEKTAYEYPSHQRDAEAGYAALIAYNEWLSEIESSELKANIKTLQIDSTFKFANNFPTHKEAPVALTKAAEDLFSFNNYSRAIEASKLLVDKFPDSDIKLRKSAWTVQAHSEFELQNFKDSETSYQQAILLLSGDSNERKKLEDKLAASIYKQGEASQLTGDTETAVKHYLRVGEIVPGSQIRSTAQYDAATLLLKSEQWSRAAVVLEDFRARFPDHKEQSTVTQKLALVYEKDQKNLLAAQEYERISFDKSNDAEMRRTSSLLAAELFTKEKDYYRAIEIYQSYINRFPKPYEPSMEARHSLVELYRIQQDDKSVKSWREDIISTEAKAGSASTPRMKYLAADASLQLAIPKYNIFQRSQLKKPLEKSLKVKKSLMQRALTAFELAGAYKVEEVTTAATYYSAMIYYDFSRALLQSDRPEGLTQEELAQYEVLLEEQAFPFEEQAIDLFELNAMRTQEGVYNQWIRESLRELGVLVPARYARTEKSEEYVEAIH